MKKLGLSRLQVRRAMAVGLSLLMAVTAVPANNNSAQAAAKKPAFKKASVNMNASKKLAFKKTGWTVTKVVKVKAKNAKIAKAVAAKKKVTVYGIKNGKTTVTATVKAKKGSKTKKFTIKTTVTVKKVSATISKKSIAVGTTAKITVKNKAAKATVKYTSSNTKVATVSKGTVKGVKAGSAKITVKVVLPKTKYAKKKTVKVATFDVKVTASSATTPTAQPGTSAAPGTSTAPDASVAPGTSTAPDASGTPGASATPVTGSSATPVPTTTPATDASATPAPTTNPSTDSSGSNGGINHGTVVSDAEVGTLVEFNKAVDSGKKTITFASDTLKTVDFTEDSRYKNINLIVDLPKAEVTNAATFKSITIKAVKNGTWKENGNYNCFILANTVAIKIQVAEGKIVDSISIEGATKNIDLTTASGSSIGNFYVEDIKDATLTMDTTNTKIGNFVVKESAKVTGSEINLKVAGDKSDIKAFLKTAIKIFTQIDETAKKTVEIDVTSLSADDAKGAIVAKKGVSPVLVVGDKNPKDVVENLTGAKLIIPYKANKEDTTTSDVEDGMDVSATVTLSGPEYALYYVVTASGVDGVNARWYGSKSGEEDPKITTAGSIAAVSGTSVVEVDNILSATVTPVGFGDQELDYTYTWYEGNATSDSEGTPLTTIPVNMSATNQTKDLKADLFNFSNVTKLKDEKPYYVVVKIKYNDDDKLDVVPEAPKTVKFIFLPKTDEE